MSRRPDPASPRCRSPSARQDTIRSTPSATIRPSPSLSRFLRQSRSLSKVYW
jgi:hypothetical protein